MDIKHKPDHRASPPPGELLCGHGLREMPVTRRSETSSNILIDAKRFENIKFDIDSVAGFMEARLTRNRTMTVFRNPNLRKIPSSLNKVHIGELVDYANQILKNEGKVLHPDFSHDLSTISQEIFATDPSREDIRKSIAESIQKNIQALPL